MPAYHDATEPALCDGNHGPDECRDCLDEMSAPIAVPAWLDGQVTDFNDRQDFAAAWGGR
jgi:hypothetical protein